MSFESSLSLGIKYKKTFIYVKYTIYERDKYRFRDKYEISYRNIYKGEIIDRDELMRICALSPIIKEYKDLDYRFSKEENKIIIDLEKQMTRNIRVIKSDEHKAIFESDNEYDWDAIRELIGDDKRDERKELFMKLQRIKESMK